MSNNMNEDVLTGNSENKEMNGACNDDPEVETKHETATDGVKPDAIKDLDLDVNSNEEKVYQELFNHTFDEHDEIKANESPNEPTQNGFKDETKFDAYFDGITIHRRYQLRRGKPVVKKQESTYEVEKKKPAKRKRSTEGFYKCSKCIKKFDSKTGLLNHIRMHQNVKKFTCALCQATFNTNELLIEHKVEHMDEDKIFLCKICKMAFTDHCDFLCHEVTHTNRTTYKCVECGSYQKPNYIKIHIQSHFNKQIECDECGKSYKSINSLNGHKYDCHRNNSVECVECGKMFKSNYYDIHMTTHTGVKKYQCLYCGQGFTSQSGRMVHTRKHTNEKPFVCDICDAAFYQDPDLKRHVISKHSERTKFKCEVCAKPFLSMLSLKQHAKLHTRTNVYMCPVCNKVLQNKQCLRAHIRYKHSTERPFRCDYCNLSFKDNHGITRHQNSKMHKRAVYGAENKMKNES